MRYTKDTFGNVLIVSNHEYDFLRKLKANSKLKIEDLDEYTQEIGYKLYSRSAIVMDDSEEYFLPIAKD